MPIYIDRHYIEGATKSTLDDAHKKDIAMQDKHGVRFLTYWFDEERSTAFCLIDSPSKEVVHSAHDEAHGDIPHEIIEVDPSIVESFLGRIKDPLPDKSSGEVSIDSAFRGIMFTDLKDSTLMNTLYGDTKALHLLHIHNAMTRNALRELNGSEIKHTGDGFMVSFTSITDQVNCAIAIQKSFADHNEKSNEEELFVRIGLSAGEPIEEHGDLFGTSVQLAARLCSYARPSQILADDRVKDNYDNKDNVFNDSDEIELKGFNSTTHVHNVKW